MSGTASLQSAAPQRANGGTSSAGILQRKCGCGSGKTAAAHSCDECKTKPLQRKLSIGHSHDPLEHEADKMAELVLRADAIAQRPTPSISRLAAQASSLTSDADQQAPASVERTVAAGGQAIEPAFRKEMERRFGYDFAGVRIHTGGEADRSAQDVGAAAYTVGQHVVFAAGRYAPGTGDGRRLIAHELTHVVQQTSPGRISRAPATSPGPVPSVHARAAHRVVMRRPADKPDRADPALAIRHVPEVVSADHQRSWVAQVLVRENVQWNIPGFSADDHLDKGHGLGLTFWVFDRYDPKGKKYTADELANFAVDVLVDASALVFKAGKREELVQTISEVILKNRTGSDLTALAGPVVDVEGQGFAGFHMSVEAGSDYFRTYFEDDSWNSWATFIHAQFPGQKLSAALVASANFGDSLASKGKKSKGGARPRWTADQEKALRKIIQQARKNSPKTLLPSRLVFYPHRDAWYLNAWVDFDTTGKSATHKAVRLKEGESVDSLFRRVVEATGEALEITRTEENKHREAEMPPWAAALKANVEQALGGKTGEDIPDGMTLTLEGRGARVRGAGGENIAQEDSDNNLETQVLLRIWVFRGDNKQPSNRQDGSVPIFPQTDAAALVKYVRNLAAVLRQGEHVPDSAKFIPSYQLGEQLLPNFDAKILPLDLGQENITVTQAHNKFSLFLDFDKQYNAIGANALYVASKLYSQRIYYDWKIYRVPADRQRFVTVDQPAMSWEKRWTYLYDLYNPGSHVLEHGDISATSMAGSVEVPADGLSTGGNDITTRVSFPKDPGDYLVSCQTRHEPIGESELRRVSSVAYYPVRTRTRDDLAKPQITSTPRGIAAADSAIHQIDTYLAADAAAQGALPERGDGKTKPEKLSDRDKGLFKVARKEAESQKAMLERRESGDFLESIKEEMADGRARLIVARRLKKRLPEVLEQARGKPEAGIAPTRPEDLLVDDLEILALYIRLKREGTHAAGYVKDLETNLAELQKVLERAALFEDDFNKQSAGGCFYTPEAVFLSKVDGHLYPLLLMIGESPTKLPGERVAYTVADVTTPETKKKYRGGSFEPGVKGHQEAIDNAFKAMGDGAIYGEGWIAVRMPVGGPGPKCADRRHPDIQYYDSEEGILDSVIKVLGILSAFVGVFALALSGFGLGAAGALIGVLAAGMGAASAVHNLGERADRKTLAFDAELVSDVLAIVGLGEAIAAARLATLPAAMRGFQAYQRLGRFVALFQLGTGTASALLIPIQLLEDLNKIDDLNLPEDEKLAMIKAAWGNLALNVVVAGAMFAHSRIASHMEKNRLPAEEDYAAVREQAELAALDNTDNPKSLHEQGWLDADGNWTSSAPEPIRRRAEEQARLARGETPVLEAIPDAAQKAVDKVNRGEARIEGKPGAKDADVGDTHHVVEVEEPGGGISCEYHSAKGPRVPCPVGMGIPKNQSADHPRETPSKRKDATTAGDAPREESPTRHHDDREPIEPGETQRSPREVEAPHRNPAAADAEPKSAQAIVDEAAEEVRALRAKIAENDKAIKANQKAVADTQAKLAVAQDEYTATPHGNDQNEAGRAQKKKRASALRKMQKAEDALLDVQRRTSIPSQENDNAYKRLRELDRILHPEKYPVTKAQKGSRAEEEAYTAVEEGKTYAEDGDQELKGKFEFRGSSQNPQQPEKAKPQGLDGGFENTSKEEGPPHIAVEIKHEDTALKPGQETHAWVDDRLDDAVGPMQAIRMRKEGYQYWVLRYRPGKKSVQAKLLWEWVPDPAGRKDGRGNWLGTVHPGGKKK